MAYFKHILNLIVPSRCVCGAIITDEENHLCSECWDNIGFIATKSVCQCCGNPFEFEMMEDAMCSECIANTPEFDKARFVFKYNDVSGKIITGLKYTDKTPYAKTLAKFMSNKINELSDDYDLIVSVPIHPKKLVARKYNQSALLANRLGKITKKAVNNLVLRKVRNIRPQASLTRKERIENAKDAYAVNIKYKDNILGKKILLVDDVITTGATANECAKILKKAGADKVYLLTATKTILEK